MNILSERSVFKISGEDSFDFLQSVVTADISPLKEERAVATCLLSAQGRVLFDFLFKTRILVVFVLDEVWGVVW